MLPLSFISSNKPPPRSIRFFHILLFLTFQAISG